MFKPRIGAVSYLNTVPLVQGLPQLAPDFELVFDYPSRLADRLAAGQLDAALVPVVEALLNDSYTIVSDACIGCCGPVWSVKLLSRVPVSRIRSVALDEGSRTSVALVKLLLRHKFRLEPELSRLPLDVDYRQTASDAVLVIGDRAMQSSCSDFPEQFDLGKCWFDWTGLPFVFAVWAARPGADFDRLAQVLSEARNQGLSQSEFLARQHASHYGLSVGDCRRYFCEFLNFRLGEEDRLAIRHFAELAGELELLPAGCELKYHDCPVA